MDMCRKCKGNLILGRIWVGGFQPDQEPHEAGKLIDIKEIEVEIFFSAHYCQTCGTLHDIWDDSERHLPEE